MGKNSFYSFNVCVLLIYKKVQILQDRWCNYVREEIKSYVCLHNIIVHKVILNF